MSKHYRAQRRFAFFALLSGFPALCLMLVGVFGPAWSGQEGRANTTIREGIWFSVACPASGNGSCVYSTRDWIFENFGMHGAVSVLDGYHWQELRVMTICALEGSLNAALAAAIVLAKRGKSSSVCILTIGLVSSIISSILVLLPVLKVFVVSDSARWRTDWSRLLTLIACVLEFVCAILYVFAVAQSCLRIIKGKDDQDEDDLNDSVVVFEQDPHDDIDALSDPGLELPSYSESVPVTPPPCYTELPDNPTSFVVSEANMGENEASRSESEAHTQAVNDVMETPS